MITAIENRRMPSLWSIVRRILTEAIFFGALYQIYIHIPNADTTDSKFFHIWISVSLIARISFRLRPLPASWVLLHCVVVLQLLLELDKMAGYPDRAHTGNEFFAALAGFVLFSAGLFSIFGRWLPESWPSILLTVAVLSVSLTVIVFLSQSLSIFLFQNDWVLSLLALLFLVLLVIAQIQPTNGAIQFQVVSSIAVTLLLWPIVSITMQGTRQIFYHSIPGSDPCVFASKITQDRVYGVRFSDSHRVYWFERHPDTLVLKGSESGAGLGSGTMEAQGLQRSMLVWKVSARIFCKK